MARAYAALLFALALATVACESTPNTYVAKPCTVILDGADLPSLSAAGGERLVLTGDLFTKTSDTVIRFGGVEILPDDVLRQDCDACDQCLFPDEGELCGDCRAICAGDGDTLLPCEEQIVVTTPPLDGATVAVVVANRNGVSAPLVLPVDPVDPGDDDSAAP